MPSYHGWYVALWCGIPSGIVLIVWLIIEAPILEALLLSYLGPETANQSDAMIGLLLNDVRNLASGDVVSREVDPALQAAADRYASMKSTAQAAVLAIGVAMAGAGFGWAWRRIAPGLRARNKGRAGGKHRAHPVLLRRHRHHHRHRPLGAVRIDPLLFDHPLLGLPVRPEMEPADRHPRGSGGQHRRLRRDPALHRHANDHADRHAGGAAGGPLRRHLHGRIREPPVPQRDQAHSGDPGWRADGGLRLLRGPGGWRPRSGASANRSASTSRRKARSPPASSWAS